MAIDKYKEELASGPQKPKKKVDLRAFFHHTKNEPAGFSQGKLGLSGKHLFRY